MDCKPHHIAVIGSGYVGTVVAACLAHVGHQVVGVEADPAKLSVLQEGAIPFHEAGLEDLVRSGIERGNLSFVGQVAEAMDRCRIVFICVGTPPGPDGSPDMSAVEAVAQSIAESITSHHVLVNKSTVPIGTGRWLASVMEEYASDDLFSVVSNPEFLREGSAVQDFLHPDRVVLGSEDETALDLMAEVYRPILEQSFPGPGLPRGPVPLMRTTLATAEMVKYASNAFLATKISFANEIARLCEFVGADVTEVTSGMGLDARIGGQFLDAGLGWGGSCFGKDTAALIATASEYGYQPRILDAVLHVNSDQRNLAVEQLLRYLKTLRGARVAVLGLAFKAGTDDLRDSPAVDICERLLKRGAIVTAYDPMVGAVPSVPEIRIAASAYEAAKSADAIVLATEWPEFLALDLQVLRGQMRGNVFFDGRNNFDVARVLEADFEYLGIGRGSSPRRLAAGLPSETPA